jgi:hypothetical protein
MAGVGPSRKPGYRPPKPTSPFGSGGTVAPPHPKGNVPPAGTGSAGGLSIPPFLTYDPAIEAQRRAAERGLEDTEAQIKTEGHFAGTKLHEAMRNLRRTTHYKRTDIGTSFQRGSQKLGYEEADTRKKAQRTGEDFQTRLNDIARQFGELGHRQGEASNAAGVLDAGTGAASAAARNRNQGFAEAPIHTAQGRLGEDLMTALSRIGVSRGQLAEDRGRSLGRLKQDTTVSRRAARREYGQQAFLRNRKQEEARREQAISNQDLIAEEIYSARQNRPGVFSTTGKRRKR